MLSTGIATSGTTKSTTRLISHILISLALVREFGPNMKTFPRKKYKYTSVFELLHVRFSTLTFFRTFQNWNSIFSTDKIHAIAFLCCELYWAHQDTLSEIHFYTYTVTRSLFHHYIFFRIFQTTRPFSAHIKVDTRYPLLSKLALLYTKIKCIWNILPYASWYIKVFPPISFLYRLRYTDVPGRSGRRISCWSHWIPSTEPSSAKAIHWY